MKGKHPQSRSPGDSTVDIGAFFGFLSFYDHNCGRWTFYNDKFRQLALVAMCLPGLLVGGYLSERRIYLRGAAF